MIQMINMYTVLEKELELESQGIRRTRRWIGDDSRVIDGGWYQGKQSLISEHTLDLGEVNRASKFLPGLKTNRSMMGRLLYLLRNRRQPVMDVSELR